MVTRVVAQNVVKFDVVDLVGSLGLEAFHNDGVFLFAQLHSEVVENGAETREVDETRPATVLVLEVWLD